MAPATTEPSDREERLDAVLTGYLKAVDGGQPPDRYGAPRYLPRGKRLTN